MTLGFIKFKNNTVRGIASVIVGACIFYISGSRREGFASGLVRVSDNGYTAQGQFASHFPSSTQIILDSRVPIFDGNGTVTSYGQTAASPKVGDVISGPFIQPGTTVVSAETSPMPSNPYVPGELITISKPIQNMKEDRGDVFTYSFAGSAPPPPPPTPSSSCPEQVCPPPPPPTVCPIQAPCPPPPPPPACPPIPPPLPCPAIPACPPPPACPAIIPCPPIKPCPPPKRCPPAPVCPECPQDSKQRSKQIYTNDTNVCRQMRGIVDDTGLCSF